MLSQKALDKSKEAEDLNFLKNTIYCSLQTGDISLSQFIKIMNAETKKEVIDIINLVI
jgi:hypothetical protein